jgi:hypothetical protein
MAFSHKKHPFEVLFAFLGGLERIRTAVEAFAELCLATRPQDHIYLRITILDLRLLTYSPRIRIAKVQDSCQTPKVFLKKI